MDWYYILLILLAYGIGELIIGFFFNYKIFMIAKERFSIAALMGAISTILYTSLIATSAFIAGTSLDGAWWFIAASAGMMGIGNFFAALLVPIVSRKMKHLETKNKNDPEKIQKEINNKEFDDLLIKELEEDDFNY